MDDDHVSPLAGSKRANAIGFSKILRAIGARDVNGLGRSEPGFDQQFDFPLIPESGKNAAVPSRSSPAINNPPAFTKSRSNCISFLNSSGQEEGAVPAMRARVIR